MKKAIFLLLILPGCFYLYSQTSPDAMLPSEKEVPGWRTSGESKIFNTDNLKNLKGDEAELIIEYGLRSVVSKDYYNFNGKVINIQVYRMNNTFGSYGIFLQKSKNEKVFKEFGNACFEKKGSFQFWKQMYYIVMNSDFSGDTISKGFRQMAGVIDSKIKSRGVLPDILKFAENKNGTATLFKGPLALGNIYYFGPVNVFNINEGLAIENNESKEIILKYADNNEAVRRFSDAAGILGRMQRFSEFKLVDQYSFTMKDKDKKTLTFKVENECLDILIK